ncbi:superoxide dismutase family protein [Jeotgalibacillus campisalis]|uniref:Superoxide dismutase-like protein yojM n=1 Tax=Jeotgalibacillus campisalis TaxID=220754 RepID=A0A0C2RFY4_9BACL|nr:superoxide dismutase family protein [Jeotgalibacillus campisalis]KIL49075.1 superoxide dismutase-like protein yojM precursor [Jeotgalibacillus campisalis]
MKIKSIGICFFIGAMLGGCNAYSPITGDEKTVPVSEEAAPMIEVIMKDVNGESMGTALLNETEKGVSIAIKAEGLEPGEKAIHFHEKGSCEPPEFTSAGGHFNPEGKQHGFDNPEGFHAGDLPNLVVDQDGTVDLELVVEAVTLKKGAKNSLLDEDGSSLVIHEGPDDYKTDPSGKSGKRILCGEING